MDLPIPRPLTLLRTAAGSPPAVTQYRAFHALGCRIVAADCDARSVGFSFALFLPLGSPNLECTPLT